LKKERKPWHSLFSLDKSHVFAARADNDFLCSVCGEPRAMHERVADVIGTAEAIPVDHNQDARKRGAGRP